MLNDNESDLQKTKSELEQLVEQWMMTKKILHPGETVEIDVRIVSPPKVRIEIIPAENVDGAIALLATVHGVRTDQVEYRSLTELRQGLQKVLASLEEREVKILDALYCLNQTTPQSCKEVGVRFGVSGSRIRQIERKAIRRLRHPTQLRLLQEFMSTKED